MKLEDAVEALREEQQYALAIELLELALPIWKQFVQNPETDLQYLISPFHGIGDVDPNIVANAIQLIKKRQQPHSTQERQEIETSIKAELEAYAEHNMGIDDWELDIKLIPQLVFHAAFNMLAHTREKLTPSKELHIYVSINKSVDALIREKLLDWDAVRVILQRYHKEG